MYFFGDEGANLGGPQMDEGIQYTCPLGNKLNILGNFINGHNALMLHYKGNVCHQIWGHKIPRENFSKALKILLAARPFGIETSIENRERTEN